MYKYIVYREREREFISLLIMNDTHKKISIIYRRIVKLVTGTCEGTSGLRVEQQPNLYFVQRVFNLKLIFCLLFVVLVCSCL